MKMSSSSEESESDTPPEIEEAARAVIENLLPPKSKDKYIKTYESFVQWKKERKSKSLSENVFLAYFGELSKKVKPPTLWVIYSMLKCTVLLKHNVNLKNYGILSAMLKRQSYGYKSKKSKVLTGTNVNKFLKEAPDSEFLDVKVVLIFGINGACRCNEITNISVRDVETYDGVIIVTLRKTKTDRTFVIREESAEMVQKYIALRRIDVKSDRFFQNYKNNKCTKQVIGRHKIAAMPKVIATYLKLPNPEYYTGHCFRRSSATVLDDPVANLIALKRIGGYRADAEAESGWKSDPEADSGWKSEDESFSEESNENKSNINKISESVHTQPSASKDLKVSHASTSRQDNQAREQGLEPQDHTEETSINVQQTWTSLELSQTNSIPGKSTLTFKNCTFNNCTFK